jgi:hypothetical protein
MVQRKEMSILYATEQEACASLRDTLSAQVSLPPMWPITDIRVERRLSSKATDTDKYRWVVAGDYSQWP